MISAIAGENALYYYFSLLHSCKKNPNYSSLYLTLKIPLQAVYVYNFTFEITLQAVQKTFHNLLLLLSIFDLVGEHCQGHDYAHDHEQLTMTMTIIMNNWPWQVYLVATVPLFSLPQLSSSEAVRHLLTLILPYVLPVAHIGMVRISICVRSILPLVQLYRHDFRNQCHGIRP